ncbi:MAG: hypothetical protein RIM23_19850 [Coleofasciculus sp. G3-WIS-01]
MALTSCFTRFGVGTQPICFKLDYEPINRPKPHPVVGVDLGLKALAVLSTGIVEGAKSYRKYEKKLSRMQWLSRHKQIGSVNWLIVQFKANKPSVSRPGYGNRFGLKVDG